MKFSILQYYDIKEFIVMVTVLNFTYCRTASSLKTRFEKLQFVLNFDL